MMQRYLLHVLVWRLLMVPMGGLVIREPLLLLPMGGLVIGEHLLVLAMGSLVNGAHGIRSLLVICSRLAPTGVGRSLLLLPMVLLLAVEANRCLVSPTCIGRSHLLLRIVLLTMAHRCNVTWGMSGRGLLSVLRCNVLSKLRTERLVHCGVLLALVGPYREWWLTTGLAPRGLSRRLLLVAWTVLVACMINEDIPR